jgi:hypothetical protein
MHKILPAALLGLALAAGSAYAASHAGAPMAGASGAKPAASKAAAPAAPATPATPAAKEPTKQQAKMVDCNKDAKEKNLKGDERKKFMSSCLKDKQSAQKAQQAKMTTCNKEAGEKKLKGDERKKFMSSCLSA